MSQYHVVIRRDDDNEYQVWLDASDGVEPDANAMVLGTGATRDEALKAAADELHTALTRVKTALSLDVEVLR